MWQTARMPILSPAMPRAWSRASGRRAKVQGIAGLGLLAATLAMVPAQTGLIGAFGMVAALLVGAALVLPWMVAGVVGIFARRPAGAVTQWFWADTAQQVPGLSLALMALLLALASNVGVGTMVASFRVTFTGWLDQRLASEVYLTTRTPQEARLILQKIAPRVDRVLPILSVDIPLSGQPGSLYGIADDATYRDNWAMLQAMPDVWDRVARGEVVLINEQLGRRAGLTLGDMLDLPSGALPVGGIYSDYGNPRAQALLTLSRFDAAYPDVPRLRFGLRMDPAQAVDLVRDVSTGYGLPQGSVVLQADIKAYSLDVFERTFAVTGALNVLTLGVATVALFASLLTLADLRLPQLAPVWALGLTRRHLSVLEMLRILALAAVTLAVAIPLGLALAWLLLARVNVAAFGWQLPMQVFPGDWVRLAMAAMPAAGLAAAVPVWRLMRLPPAALLRVFAHERG